MHNQMIKICYISDLHFERYSKKEVENQLKLLFKNQIIELYSCDLFVIAGDITDDFEIFKHTINIIYDYVITKNLALEMVYVPGNHDLWDVNHCFENINTKIKKIKELAKDKFNVLYRDTKIYTFKEVPFII